MSKVPVGASIAHAYEFFFGRFFQIIGTAWLPGLLNGLVLYVLLSGMHDFGPVHAPPPATAAGLLGWSLFCFAFFLAIAAVLNISLTQEALGVRKDLTLAHFVIGPRELRLFFGYLRYVLLYVVLYAIVLLLCGAAMWAAKTYGARLAVSGYRPATPLAIAFSVVLLAAFLLSMLRIMFMLAPIASAEHRTRLSRAWEISAHSTWRILLVCLGTFLPLAVAAAFALYYAIGAADFQALSHAIQAAKPGDPGPLVDFTAAHAVQLAVFSAVLSVLHAIFLAGAAAHAYRVTTGHEEPELEDDAALVAPLLTPVEPVHREETHHDHGHGGHDDHGHHGSHEDHGHGHEDHGHEDKGHEDKGHGDGRGDHDRGHDDHGHGHGDHAHGHHDSHASEDEDGDDDDDSGDDDHASHGDHGHHDNHHHATAADEAA